MKTALIIVLIIFTQASYATILSLGEFSGNETPIDFNDILSNEHLDTQYQSAGVIFTGGGHGYPFSPGINGTMAISNWANDPVSFNAPIEALFDTSQTRVGFFLGGTNSVIRDYYAAIFSGNELVDEGVFLADTLQPGGNILSTFIGFEYEQGIDKIIVHGNSANWAFLIDDFRFEAAVPTPPTTWLFSIGLIGLLASTRRKLT